MSALLLPMAHHSLIAAIPFVIPMVIIVGGMALLALRERLSR